MFGPPDRFGRSASVLALVTLLLATLLLAAKGLNFAVEFTGGTIIQVHYPEPLASASVHDTLVRAGFADVSVREFGEYPSDLLIVLKGREDDRAPRLTPPLVQQVIAALSTERRPVEVTRADIIYPSVGRELLSFGAVPLILACVAIMIHPAIRCGWRFALSVAVINVRNMVIVLGFFLSAYAVFQWEFSLLALTAMDGLAILVTGVGAAHVSRASPSC
jgi:preprotein translocase subunit SecF